VVNTFNETYNWYWNGKLSGGHGNELEFAIGTRRNWSGKLPEISFGGAVNGFGITPIGNQWQGNFVSATMITGDSLIWTKGRHTITLGGEFLGLSGE